MKRVKGAVYVVLFIVGLLVAGALTVSPAVASAVIGDMPVSGGY